MAILKTREASGHLELKYLFRETSSSHKDSSSCTSLVGEGLKVVMIEESETNNMHKMNQSKSEVEKWEISTAELIALIKENGKKI